MPDPAHFTQKDRDVILRLVEVNARIEEKLERALSDIKSMNDNLVTRKEFESATFRIKNLEDNQRWLARTVIGLVITGLVGLIIVLN